MGNSEKDLYKTCWQYGFGVRSCQNICESCCRDFNKEMVTGIVLTSLMIIKIIFCICIALFPRDIKRCCLYYYPVRKSSQSFRFTKNDLQLAKCTPYQHLDCNIPHNRQVPDTLWSTKQIQIKYLAQGHKHAGRSGARTHNIDGLVIMSPARFR